MMAGGIVGGIIAGGMGQRLNMSNSFLSVLLGCVFVVLIGVVLLFDMSAMQIYVVIMAAGAVFMSAVKMVSIAMMTFIQKETPTELIGKILSLLMVIPFIGQSIGYPVQGMLFQVFENSPWVVIFACSIIMIAMAIFSYFDFKKVLKQS